MPNAFKVDTVNEACATRNTLVVPERLIRTGPTGNWNAGERAPGTVAAMDIIFSRPTS